MCLSRVVPNRTVYRFVSVCVQEPVKCTAALFVNKLINVLHKIICSGPYNFRLDRAVNEIKRAL